MPPYKNTPNTRTEKACLLLFTVLVAFYVVLAADANADLTVGRFALFMDERITFDGVKNILHPEGLKHFVWGIADGGDQRYGRSLWNTMAVFSFLPERLFGEPGQIFAGRMTGVIILLSAFILFSLTFIKRWSLRFLLLASLLAMPYTDYYMSMPKPEPLQMLFLALFLYFFKKSNMSFRGSYWIFLGLAFGTKISTLPGGCVFGIAASLKYLPGCDPGKYVSDLLVAAGFFLAGLAVAVPILLPGIALYVIAFMAVDWLLVRIPAIHGWVARLLLVAVLVVANISALFLEYARSGLAVWEVSTFLNTGHGADHASVGFASWVDFLLLRWMVAPVAVTGIVLVVVLALAAHSIRTLFAGGLVQGCLTGTALPLVIMAAGLILNLAIFTAVHRLWGFYLFPGTVLFLVGVFALFDAYLAKGASPPGNRFVDPGSYLSVSGLLLVSAITACWWFPQSLSNFQHLSHRTKNPEYRREYSSYLAIKDFLSRYATTKKGRTVVLFDPSLFIPLSNGQYQINEFWTRYPDWKANAEVLIIGRSHTPNHAPVSRDSPRFALHAQERLDYEKNVMPSDPGSLQQKRYKRHLQLPNGGEILVRASLNALF